MNELTHDDRRIMMQKGITEEQLLHQLNCFRQGFPFLKIKSAATVGNGIRVPSEDECMAFEKKWNYYLRGQHKVVKFVPASGAASRMFKMLFAFLNEEKTVPGNTEEKDFFANIRQFAFFEALNAKCETNEGKSVDALLQEKDFRPIIENVILDQGLGYGKLPKGLILFHQYDDVARTAMEEHLVEGAEYAAVNGKANIHFTVSHEHLESFRKLVDDKKSAYARRFGIDFDITFSEQKPQTDTIAVNPDNTPFRNKDNSLLFRPGGHGALIENLNAIDADVVFIKNVDNVVPEYSGGETTFYKKVLGGVLIDVQQRIFDYLRMLDGDCPADKLDEILQFTKEVLWCVPQEEPSKEQLKDYLIRKLNRPVRVCGVVKNVGEPGGGPYLAYNADHTYSLQILEKSQIDLHNEAYREMFSRSTHFNPVDIVCGLKDVNGVQFDLTRYVDASTGFISEKSKDGQPLKALELPGLWNGAMSDWNTVMVEVPLATFNPVKTVNELLREQHRRG